MRTLDSPISSRPTRWSMATRFTPGQRPRMPSPISRIFASAIGACASYSRNFTGRPPRLVPHDAGEDDDATGAGLLDRGRDRVGRERRRDDPVRVAAGAAAHRREEAELVVGAEPVLGGDVLVRSEEHTSELQSR